MVGIEGDDLDGIGSIYSDHAVRTDATLSVSRAVWSNKETAQAAAKDLPMKPSPDLSAEEVITAITRGLQYNDEQNTALLRCYDFMTLTCIKLVTGRGNVPEERTLEKFLFYAAESSKLKPFMEAINIEYGQITRIPKTLTRGEIASMPVLVESRRQPHRAGITISNDEKKEEENKVRRQQFMIRLEQERRPPYAGCYLVTDIFDVDTVTLVSKAFDLD